MGTTICINSWINSIEPAEWVSLIGIIVNSLLAYWIVKTIQNRLTNKRVLKDHFINEIKDKRNEFKSYLNKLYSNQITGKKAIPWFKLMYIKVDDIMSLIDLKYKINKQLLNPYQIELRELITENSDFINQFQSDTPIQFSEESKSKFIIFQQKHNHLFNEIIIRINDSD